MDEEEHASSDENTDNNNPFTFPVVIANPINYHKIIQTLPSSATTLQQKPLIRNQARTSHISC